MIKLSPRQFYFFLACIAPVGKLLLLPSQLCTIAENDLLLPVLAQYLLQGAVVFSLVFLIRQEQTLYQLVQRRAGKPFAAVIAVLLSAFLLFAAFLPLLEQKLMLRSVFYDTQPASVYFAPFFLLCAYFCVKPFGLCGRVFELAAPIAVVAFAGLMGLAVPSADFQAILPIGASGAKGFFSGTLTAFPWFYDSAIVLALCGRIRYEKHMEWKAPLFYLLGGLFVLFFLAVFYGIFADIAARQTFAFAKVSKYFSAVGILGRIDYIFIILLALVMVFYVSLPLQASTALFSDLCHQKVHSAWFAIPVNLLLLVLTNAFTLSARTAFSVYTGNLAYLYPAFCLLLPLLLLPFGRNYEKKTR